jgi:hypothetical protein
MMARSQPLTNCSSSAAGLLTNLARSALLLSPHGQGSTDHAGRHLCMYVHSVCMSMLPLQTYEVSSLLRRLPADAVGSTWPLGLARRHAAVRPPMHSVSHRRLGATPQPVTRGRDPAPGRFCSLSPNGRSRHGWLGPHRLASPFHIHPIQ